jgi:hypothetical protein
MDLLKRLLYELLGICETSGHESGMDVVEPVIVHPELFRIIDYVFQIRWHTAKTLAYPSSHNNYQILTR